MSQTYDVTQLPWGATWPSQEEFNDLADQGYRVIPIVMRVLADSMTPIGFYERLGKGGSGTFLLESAESGQSWSRYSFIGVNSMAQLRSVEGQAQWLGHTPVDVPRQGDVMDVVKQTLNVLKSPQIQGLPHFTSGLVGTVGWDVIRHWETSLPSLALNDTDQPELVLALATDLAVVDHYNGSLWLIANAVNIDNKQTGRERAYADACERVHEMVAALSSPSSNVIMSTLDSSVVQPELNFRTPQDVFEKSVELARQHIIDGDAFQIVLSQRVDIDCAAQPFDVYRVLRTLNPSPYMYFFSLTDHRGRDFSIVGSSPETLIKVEHGTAMTYPIAGSRPRGANEEEDNRLAAELLADPKERAEHIMLVDLARNDLSRVCDPQTIDVATLMNIKKYSHIMHIASTVMGQVRDDVHMFDVFTSAFPAGTLSGAPKTKAIEIIDNLEPTDRGIYGGTVGYFDFSGNMDMAITIRTAFIRDGQASVQAGAGIVLDSVAYNEWMETRNKAAASVKAVQIASQLSHVSTREVSEQGQAINYDNHTSDEGDIS